MHKYKHMGHYNYHTYTAHAYLVRDDGQELAVEVQVQRHALRLAERDRACIGSVIQS